MGSAMAKVALAFVNDSDDWQSEDDCIWGELQDGCFHVRMTPWPPRPGPVRLSFRNGPDAARLRYRILTEPPRRRLLHLLQDAHPEERLLWIDETPVAWRAFSRKVSQFEVLPFETTIVLPAGKVWLEFRHCAFRGSGGFRSAFTGLRWELDVQSEEALTEPKSASR
jgi:hypothetical protein